MIVNCPTCKNQVTWNDSSPHRPFCSKRCQLIDLGEWSEEQHVIKGDQPNRKDTSEELPDIEEIEALLMKQNQDFFKD